MLRRQRGLYAPAETLCVLGKRLRSNFQPEFGDSRTRVWMATLRFSIGAVVCGNQGRKIVVSELLGRFDQGPPGSRSASLPSATVTITKCCSSQASDSSAHSNPVM